MVRMPQFRRSRSAREIRDKLLTLMPRLDRGELPCIFYGRPNISMEYQKVYCISREAGIGAPYYLVRAISRNIIVEGHKFPTDNIGRDDAIREFVKWSSVIRQIAERNASTMGLSKSELGFDFFM